MILYQCDFGSACSNPAVRSAARSRGQVPFSASKASTAVSMLLTFVRQVAITPAGTIPERPPTLDEDEDAAALTDDVDSERLVVEEQADRLNAAMARPPTRATAGFGDIRDDLIELEDEPLGWRRRGVGGH